jgi:hypothetical protein
VRQKLAWSGFDKGAIDWIAGDLAARWHRLPLADGVGIATTAEHADAVKHGLDTLQASNDHTFLALSNIIVDLEIALYYAIHPPTGGTRLRLVA